MTRELTIDLVPKNKSDKNLKGFNSGNNYRKSFRLDDHDNTDALIFFNVSTKIYSMDYGFFDGFLGESLSKLGKSQFVRKYNFICGNRLRAQIDNFISRKCFV